MMGNVGRVSVWLGGDYSLAAEEEEDVAISYKDTVCQVVPVCEYKIHL